VSDLVRIAPLTEEEQAFLQAALQFIESRASKKTRQGYRKDLERWVRFAQVRNFRLHSAPLIAAALFRDQLFEAGLKPTSARRVLASLSSVYKNVIKLSPERPLTSGNPFSPDRLQWPVASKKGQTPAMKHRDARALIAAAADDAGDLGRRDEAILQILLQTGARRASVAAILRENIGPGSEWITVVVKGGRLETLHLPSDSRETVLAWLEVAPESPHLFPSGNPARAIHPNRINELVEQRAREAGLEGSYAPHQFRAAFATVATDAGIPLRDLQAAMHHADMNTTVRYDRGVRGLDVTERVAAYREQKKDSQES
jgi:integrase/recombinase XerD